MNYQIQYIHIIRKIIGLENALSEKDFKVMTWNHDIKTLFHLKQIEQGIDTSLPDSFPVSYECKRAGAVARGLFYLLGHWGSDVMPVPKEFMEWLDKQWSDEPTKGHVDELTDRLTCHQ